eukprot:14356226-Alexandrium_andersonii.AAC.1
MAEDGVGPRGSLTLVAQARPADEGGDPLPGGQVRYVTTGPAAAGRWLKHAGPVMGRKYVHPSTRSAV